MSPEHSPRRSSPVVVADRPRLYSPFVHAERRTSFLRGAVVRAAILAALFTTFLLVSGTDVRETALAMPIAFTALTAVGCLLHWRDIVEAVRARRHG